MNFFDRKNIFWAIGGVLCAVIFIAIGWFLGHQEANYNPYQALKGYESSRHGFLVKSSEISIQMAQRAIEALKRRDVKEAVEDCKTAIDIFPIDAKPYILLTKLYLMTGQERKMFDTLTLAGRSYPDFDNIVSVIDDENLDKIPLDRPSDNIYFAAFPENKKMAISFMFDDGEANVYRALPTFEKYGFRATIPIVAGFAAENSNDPFWGSWAEWKDAADRGFEIANHSMYHRDSAHLHGSDFDVAIDQAQELIEKNTGHKVVTYVFPHDSYTPEAVSRALRAHQAVRTPEFLSNFYNRTVEIVIGGPHVSVKTAERLLDIGIKRRLWLIAKCHGVTDKVSMRSFKSITPAFLEEYLAYIHSKSDDVWVDTFSNIFGYMARRAQSTIEVKGSGENFIDFVLHNDKSQGKLFMPLTVVIKSPEGSNVKTARSADGQSVKAWPCGTEKLCVDVVSFDTNIHVQWESHK